jgi:hypothetical protein
MDFGEEKEVGGKKKGKRTRQREEEGKNRYLKNAQEMKEGED